VTIGGKPPRKGSADPLFQGDPSLLNPEDWQVDALVSCHMLSFLALKARAGVSIPRSVNFPVTHEASIEVVGGSSGSRSRRAGLLSVGQSSACRPSWIE
jgi:organic hydroperoxide reductase OsmC/OhrA